MSDPKIIELRNKYLNLIEEVVAKYSKGEITLETRDKILKDCYNSLPEVNKLIELSQKIEREQNL